MSCRRQLNFETGYPVKPLWRNENDRAVPKGLLVFLFLPTFLRGCVPPLLEVALHVGSPSLIMLCIMSPCYTLQLYQVVSPSLTLPSSRSSALSWLPLGYSRLLSVTIDYHPIWLHGISVDTPYSVVCTTKAKLSM